MTATSVASRRRSLAQRRPTGEHVASAGLAGGGGQTEEEWKNRYDELNGTIAALTARLAALQAAEEKEKRGGGHRRTSSSRSNNAPSRASASAKSSPSSAATAAGKPPKDAVATVLDRYRGRGGRLASPTSPSEVPTLSKPSDDYAAAAGPSLPSPSVHSFACDPTDRRYRPAKRYEPLSSAAGSSAALASALSDSSAALAASAPDDDEHRRKYSPSAAAACAALYASRSASRSSAYLARRAQRDSPKAATATMSRGQRDSCGAGGGANNGAPTSRAAAIAARMRSRAAQHEQERQQSAACAADAKTNEPCHHRTPEKQDSGLRVSTSDGSSSTSTTVPMDQDEHDEREYRDQVRELPEATPSRDDRRGRYRRAASLPTPSPSPPPTFSKGSKQCVTPPPTQRHGRSSSCPEARSSARRPKGVRRDSSMLLGTSWMIDQPNSAKGSLCRGCSFHDCACLEMESGEWGYWVQVDQPREGVTLPRDIVHFLGTQRGD